VKPLQAVQHLTPEEQHGPRQASGALGVAWRQSPPPIEDDMGEWWGQAEAGFDRKVGNTKWWGSPDPPPLIRRGVVGPTPPPTPPPPLPIEP